MTIILNGTAGITFPDGTTQTDGLSTPVPVADGGTGASTANDALTNLGGNGFGFKNRIINGAMVLDQRNAGASVTVTSSALYCVDRWRSFEDTDGGATVQQVADAPSGFSYSLKWTTTTADATLAAGQYTGIDQLIEGFNTADLAFGTASASPVTLSFWVKSSLTGTFGGALANSAFNRSYPFTYTISAANTWEQKSITIAGDTTGTWVGATNGIGLYVQFGMGVGSTYSGTAGAWASAGYITATGATSVIGTLNATWQVTGVQLEKGSTATSFDYRPYGTELALCQRYYQVVASGATETIGTGYFESSSVAVCPTRFMTTMRASPTLYSGTGSNYYYIYTAGSGVDYFNDLTGTAIGPNSATVYTTSNVSGTAGQAGRMVTAASGGYVAFGAEL